MKQITQSITGVDVELITFHEENVYETITNALNLNVQDVTGRDEAIALIKAKHPIALFPRGNNSFILITKKDESVTDGEQSDGNGTSGGN